MPKIKLSPSSLLYIVLLIFSGTEYLFPLLCAIVLHEAGHLLFAFLLRLKIRSISLSLLGARIETESELSYRDEFFFALGGPLFGFLGFATVFPAACAGAVPFSESFFFPFSVLSLALSIFNLLPLQTLDGGRMLAGLVFSLFSLSSGTKLLRAISFFTLLSLWIFSVYMMLRISRGLPMFVFCVIFFIKCFIFNEKSRDFTSI